MLTFSENAIILHTTPLGEADQILTLLTESRGIIRAVAKGIRRTRSKFGGKLQLFGIVTVQLYPGKNLATITQVNNSINLTKIITNSYPKYLVGCTIVEIANKLAGEEYIPAQKLYLLTKKALELIANNVTDDQFILVSYLLRALHVVGWLPNVNRCTKCDQIPRKLFFSIRSGGIVCENCVESELKFSTPVIAVKNNFPNIITALYHGDWNQISNISATEIFKLKYIFTQHISWQTGIEVKSFKSYTTVNEISNK